MYGVFLSFVPMFIRIITNIGQSCWVGAFGGGAANFEVWLVAPLWPPLGGAPANI